MCPYANFEFFRIILFEKIFMKNNLNIVFNFQTCLEALKFHKVAIILAENDKPDTALERLAKCAAIAHRMSEECDLLVQKAEELKVILY